MEIWTAESFTEGSNGATTTTRPSAGETTSASSVGQSRFGSRKKKTINAVSKRQTEAATHQLSTMNAAAGARNRMMYGMPSFAITESRVESKCLETKLVTRNNGSDVHRVLVYPPLASNQRLTLI